MSYITTNNLYNFHQFSFSTYDSDTANWTAIDINGDKLPSKTDDEEVTIVFNEVTFSDMNWHQAQTELLQACYDEAVEPLAKKFGLSALHISIEPNNYGAVMLAMIAPIEEQDKLVALISYLRENIYEAMWEYGNYDAMAMAAMDMSDCYTGDFDTVEEFVDRMKYCCSVFNYSWDESDVEYYSDIYKDAA
jgi:hypothetical protein